MYRWSKIPEEYLPEIISDISGGELYTMLVQSWQFKKIKRKDISTSNMVTLAAPNAGKSALAFADARERADKNRRSTGTGRAWEGHYFNNEFFRKIINKNIPCFLMHKVKNTFAPDVDTVVCFMTGECNDIFFGSSKRFDGMGTERGLKWESPLRLIYISLQCLLDTIILARKI